MIDGPNSKAVQLNGVDEFLDLTSTTDRCIFSPASCKLGLSAAFNLKILELKENMYIFTSGGDSVDGQGVAMYYRRGLFFLTVSTEDREWTVSVTRSVLKVNIFVSIEFSWSLQSGLELLLDGKVVAATTTYITRRTVTVSAFNTFRIGQSLGLTSTVFSRIIIEGWTLTLSTRQVREAVLPDETTTVATTTELPTTESTTQTVNTTSVDNTTTVTPVSNTTEMENTTVSETTTVTPVSNTTTMDNATVSETTTATPVTNTTALETTTVTPVSNTTATENMTEGKFHKVCSFFAWL